MRQWIAPIAAVAVFFITGGNVAAAAATYSYFATTGANLERGRGYFESVGRGILAAGATYAGAFIGGATIGGTFGTAVGAGAAGGASTAGLSGGDPLLGAAAGAAAGAVGSILGGIGGNLKGLAAIARAGAVGSASGAASGAIFGDAGGGAWRGAASAAAAAIVVAIANGDFQRASDIGQKAGGAQGKAGAEARVATSQAGDGWGRFPMPAPASLDSGRLALALSPDQAKITTSIFASREFALALQKGGMAIGRIGDIATVAGNALSHSPHPGLASVGVAMEAAGRITAGVGNYITGAGLALQAGQERVFDSVTSE